MTELPAPPTFVGRQVALFLDIDGTLIEHHPHPEDIRVSDELRELLVALTSRLGDAVAFVTGRNVEMVDRLFAPLRLPTAGLYGLEHRLTHDGAVKRADEPADLAAVANQLQNEFHTTEGIYFERKGAVLAVHTRAAPAAFPRVRQAAQNALAQLPEGYRILAGNAGLEFAPLEALKSAAIERLMGVTPFTGKLPVFLGDDVSDEVGFEYVNSLEGISIRVGRPAPTEAKFALPNVEEVHRWLADLRDVEAQQRV